MKRRVNMEHYRSIGNDQFEEENTMESMTVPDMAMSPQEILARFTQGGVDHRATYSHHDLPDLERMDLVEVQEYSEKLAQRINERKQYLKQVESVKRKRLKESLKAQKAAIPTDINADLEP